MTSSKTFHCIVDDTALITNISDIETWILQGVVHLVIPLHTLERLHLLKKDPSSIGQNARKAVKFLDDVTSNADLESRIVIQGPDDKYPTWAEVEAHYTENTTDCAKGGSIAGVGADASENDNDPGDSNHSTAEDGSTLLPMLFEKVDVNKGTKGPSPMSTPPLSPSSSGPQSSKTSPDVKNAEVLANDISPVPQTLKPLINPVVWYTHQMKNKSPSTGILYLTNSSDNSMLTRDFGVISKNIHQLRSAIGVEDQQTKNQGTHQTRHSGSPKSSSEPKTLFRYEDEESEDEEVVFKPRNRGVSKVNGNSRGSTGVARSRKGAGHSPANSLSALPNSTVPQPTPQIPVGEIDPDSFDRGSFGRGNQPLANVGGVQSTHQLHTQHRANNSRGHGHSSNNGQSRGNVSRGGRGSLDRGAARGRGRLFVP